MTLYGGGFEGRFVGQEVTGAGHDRLWELARQWQSAYDTYDATSGDRRIPLMVFTLVD